jgi:hypothetical protein
MTNDDKLPIAIPLDDLRRAAETAADELRAFAATGGSGEIASGGGSRQRGLPEELRQRLIDVRASLYQLGIYDPVLVRFDSSTAAPASNHEIAEQLTAIAGTL